MSKPTNKNPFGSICFECGALIRLKQIGNKWKKSETLNINFISHCENNIHIPTLIFNNEIQALKIKRAANKIYWKIFEDVEYDHLDVMGLRLLSVQIAAKKEGYIL